MTLYKRQPAVTPRVALQAGLEHAQNAGLTKPHDLAIAALRALTGAGYAVRKRPSGPDFEYVIRGARVFQGCTARHGTVLQQPETRGIQRWCALIEWDDRSQSHADPDTLAVIALAPTLRPWVE